MAMELMLAKEIRQLKDRLSEIDNAHLNKPKILEMVNEIQVTLEDRGYLTVDRLDEIFKEIQDVLIEKARLIKGKDYFDGKNGKNGLNGKDGIKGKDAEVDYKFIFSSIKEQALEYNKALEEKINDISAHIDNKTSAETIVEALEGLSGDERLDVSAIRNIDKLEADMQNRALEILDSRTRFLLNKQSGITSIAGFISAGVNTTVTGLGTISSPYVINSVNDATAVWGFITGTLSDQTDLQSALNLKANIASPTFTGTVTTPALTLSAFTAGSVLFAGTGGAVTQDNANLFWDDANNRLGIGLTAPTARLHVVGSGSTSATNSLAIHNSTGTNNALIVRDDGNIGIGTNSPITKLEIYANPNGNSGILVRDNNDASKSILITSSNGSTAIPYIGTNGNRRLDFGTNTTRQVTIETSGNVGIGTITPNSKLHLAGSFATSYVAKTANYTATLDDYTIDCTSGTFTVTLPTAVGITGRIYVIKNSGTGTITIDTTSSQTIDGTTTKTLSVQYNSFAVQSNGSNWIVI